MTEQSIQTYEENEISLLDILLILADSWKLLVLGPLFAGVLAGALSFLLPETFESVAVVRLTEEEVALLHAAPVLDPLIEKFKLQGPSGGGVDDARLGLKSRLTYAVDKKTKLATITAKAHTPDAAQALCSSAISFLLKELQIKGKEKLLLEQIIAINVRAINAAEDAMESIQRSLKRGGGADLIQESAIKNLSIVNADIAKRSQEIEEIRQRLEPKGLEVFVQEPGLPQRKTAPKRGLILLVVIFITEFLLLLFVFMRKAIWCLENNPETASKVEQIKGRLFG